MAFIEKTNIVNTKKIRTKPGAGKKDYSKKEIIIPDIILEYEESTGDVDFNKIAFYIHGEFHIGKTSLFTMFKNAYFITFDRKNESLKYRTTFAPDYEHVLAIVYKLLEERKNGKIKIDHLIFDNTRVYNKIVQIFTCKQLGIEKLGQNDMFGADWGQNQTNLLIPMLELINSGVTIHGIAHTTIKDINTVEGKLKNKEIPDGGGQINTLFCEQTDITARYTYDIYGKRILQIEGTCNQEAASKVKNHFLYTDGTRMKEIPLGKDENEAYANLLKAFNNQFTKVRTRLK